MYEFGPTLKTIWSAGYKMPVNAGKEGMKTAFVDIDFRTTECPKSILLLNPEASELVQINSQATASGVDALGPPHEWPGVFYDAVTILAQRRAADESAQRDAINKL